MRKFHSTIAATMLVMIGSANSGYTADMALRSTISAETPMDQALWSGFYAGGALTFAYTKDHDPTFILGPWDFYGSNDGYALHAGYTHQFGNFVIGAEYEYSDINLQYIGEDGLGPIPVFVEDSHSIRGRVGIALDRFQFYALGGLTRYSVNIGLVDWKPTVGAGFDVAVTDHLRLGGQYTYSWYDDFDGMPLSGYLEQYSVRLGYQF